MNPYQLLESHLIPIEKILGVTFNDKSLLLRAFIHSSFLNEHKTLHLQHNERLEFLGDAVLNLLITEHLFKYLPDTAEGTLSDLRSHIVSAPMCSEFIRKLELEEYVLVGRGEKLSARLAKTSIFADLFEAILGAIYLDGGLEKTRHFLFQHFAPEITKKITQPERNYKALLQEFFQKTKQLIPTYKVLESSGPDHDKQFTIGVFMEDILIGTGEGNSKKEAEQKAARAAYEKHHK